MPERAGSAGTPSPCIPLPRGRGRGRGGGAVATGTHALPSPPGEKGRGRGAREAWCCCTRVKCRGESARAPGMSSRPRTPAANKYTVPCAAPEANRHTVPYAVPPHPHARTRRLRRHPLTLCPSPPRAGERERRRRRRHRHSRAPFSPRGEGSGMRGARSAVSRCDLPGHIGCARHRRPQSPGSIILISRSDPRWDIHVSA